MLVCDEGSELLKEVPDFSCINASRTQSMIQTYILHPYFEVLDGMERD